MGEGCEGKINSYHKVSYNIFLKPWVRFFVVLFSTAITAKLVGKVSTDVFNFIHTHFSMIMLQFSKK